jgi:putative Mg2+ transporter-C (MgtC) family protein
LVFYNIKHYSIYGGELEISWFDLELIFRLFLSILLGALIGYEREITHKPAGLRTHIFVCMGACLFTISSFFLVPENSIGNIDTTRIASGIVAGISFIGAGSIIATRGDVKGLTTAANLWVIAAIGLMVGLGNYILPVIASIIVFFILRLGRMEKKKIKI